MNTYHDKLEDLLLAKDFDELSQAEKAYVASVLASAAAGDTEGSNSAADTYQAQRAMRLKSRAVLAAEVAPADPAGLAAVMGRVRPTRRVVPLWQAAAAVVLVGLFAWFGRGLSSGGEVESGELLTQIDTILKEVKVVDTVYLPAAEEHPLLVDQASPVKVVRQVKRKAPVDDAGDQITGDPARLAEAERILPAPEVLKRPAGGQANPQFRPQGMEAWSDKFSLGY